MDDAAIRRARAEDGPTVLAILNEAAAWLRLRGVAQWPPVFEPGWIEPALGGGHVWLVEVGGEGLATMSVTWSDRLWPDDGTAGYVHRLAARRRALGLGAWLLGQADRIVAARGRTHLRLDCVAANTRLRRFYEGLGFAYRGEVEFPRAELLWSTAPLLVSQYERAVAR